MFGSALPGRYPIKVYSMSLYPLFPHFLRVFGSPPNFPFTGSGAHSLGAMFTLGLPPCSEFLNLSFKEFYFDVRNVSFYSLSFFVYSLHIFIVR